MAMLNLWNISNAYCLWMFMLYWVFGLILFYMYRCCFHSVTNLSPVIKIVCLCKSLRLTFKDGRLNITPFLISSYFRILCSGIEKHFLDE